MGSKTISSLRSTSREIISTLLTNNSRTSWWWCNAEISCQIRSPASFTRRTEVLNVVDNVDQINARNVPVGTSSAKFILIFLSCREIRREGTRERQIHRLTDGRTESRSTANWSEVCPYGARQSISIPSNYSPRTRCDLSSTSHDNAGVSELTNDCELQPSSSTNYGKSSESDNESSKNRIDVLYASLDFLKWQRVTTRKYERKKHDCDCLTRRATLHWWNRFWLRLYAVSEKKWLRST